MADCRNGMLCDGLLSCLPPLSRLAATVQTHHPRRSLLSFINLSPYARTHIYNHGCKSLKGFGYVSPHNTAPCEANVLLGKLFGNKEMRLLMLGLDAAGKTSTRPRFSHGVGLS